MNRKCDLNFNYPIYKTLLIEHKLHINRVHDCFADKNIGTVFNNHFKIVVEVWSVAVWILKRYRRGRGGVRCFCMIAGHPLNDEWIGIQKLKSFTYNVDHVNCTTKVEIINWWMYFYRNLSSVVSLQRNVACILTFWVVVECPTFEMKVGFWINSILRPNAFVCTSSGGMYCRGFFLSRCTLVCMHTCTDVLNHTMYEACTSAQCVCSCLVVEMFALYWWKTPG